jgi:hypothetical protein
MLTQAFLRNVEDALQIRDSEEDGLKEGMA